MPFKTATFCEHLTQLSTNGFQSNLNTGVK